MQFIQTDFIMTLQLNELYRQSSLELDLEVIESPNRVVRFHGRTLNIRAEGIIKFFTKTKKSRTPIFSVAAVSSKRL